MLGKRINGLTMLFTFSAAYFIIHRPTLSRPIVRSFEHLLKETLALRALIWHKRHGVVGFNASALELVLADHSQSGSSMLLLQEIVTVSTGNMYSLALCCFVSATETKPSRSIDSKNSVQRSISFTHAHSTFLHFYYNFKLETNYKYRYIICPKPILQRDVHTSLLPLLSRFEICDCKESKKCNKCKWIAMH